MRIFLLDGIGATLSAFTTGIILPFFYEWTGLPNWIAYSLAGMGVGFAAYSLSCFWFVKRSRPSLLLAVIIANLLYCALAGVIALTLTELTLLGRAYFVSEIAIILSLVYLESMHYRKPLPLWQ